jgi:hypothetical protein
VYTEERKTFVTANFADTTQSKQIFSLFLGALATLQKATISFVMTVRLSVAPQAHMEQLSSYQTDFHEILHLRFFRKSVEEIQVSLKSDKNKGYFT